MVDAFKRKNVSVIACVSACVFLLASPALAAEKFQGNDVSRTRDGNTTMQICDKESDGHRAYTRFDRNRNGTDIVLIDNSAGGFCANEFSGSQIIRHQTCEVRGGDVGGGDDVCTNYSDHF